jgi:hypothetical protein
LVDAVLAEDERGLYGHVDQHRKGKEFTQLMSTIYYGLEGS